MGVGWPEVINRVTLPFVGSLCMDESGGELVEAKGEDGVRGGETAEVCRDA